jgi:hypothetical protein
MDLFTSPSEDEEMSLRELAMPSMEDIEMQKSDLALATTHYKVKPRIIYLVATNPFRGLEDDNTYRHIKEFMMICYTVQQGVLAAWFKWILFLFSLEDEARRWYTLVSVEAKGNWDELVKKFLLKFFPISKVQDLRRQVLTFKQGEDEGIDEAWDRFNELLDMCASSDIMDKTISEAAQILQRISNGQRTQHDCQRRCREEQNDKSKSKVLAEFCEEDEPEVKEDEPIIQETEDPLPK